MGVEIKRLFFRNSAPRESVSPEMKAYRKWVATSEKRLKEAEDKNLYPRFRTFTTTNFYNLFEIRKLPDTTYVISVFNSAAGHINLDSAVVVHPDHSVHLLDASLVPGHRPTTHWEERVRPTKDEFLRVLEYRLDRARIFDVRTDDRWRGGLQPTADILSAVQIK